MSKYRAIVSIEFDDEEVQEFAEMIGAGSIDPDDYVSGHLDEIFGSTWIEQLFKDGEPTIYRLSGGIMVEVSEHS